MRFSKNLFISIILFLFSFFVSFNNVNASYSYKIFDDATDKQEYQIDSQDFEGADLNLTDCSSILPKGANKIFKNIMDFIKYLGPILASIFTILDLAKGVVSGKVDGKKIGANFGKRMVAAIAIFFVVVLVENMLKAVGITAPVDCFR